MSYIYRPAQEIDKDVIWNHLIGVNTILDLPWCIIGDLNEMECLPDKIGGTHLTLDKVLRMCTFLESIDGESAPPIGWLFIWKKKIS